MKKKIPGTFFILKKKCLVAVQENRGEGVKAILTKSKYERIFSRKGFPYRPSTHLQQDDISVYR